MVVTLCARILMTSLQERPPIHTRNGTGASTTDSSRSQSADPSQKGRTPFKPNHLVNNGVRPGGKFGPQKPQRVPSADEFPVLGGAPSSRASSNGATTPGYSGPTAAQVLQAPPPRKEVHTRGSTPDQLASATASKVRTRIQKEPDDLENLHLNGQPEVNGVTHEHVNKLSFAAAATAVPGTVKEVSVSA